MSRAIKKIPYKFVHVYWIDIQSDSSWRSVEDVKEDDLPRNLASIEVTKPGSRNIK